MTKQKKTKSAWIARVPGALKTVLKIAKLVREIDPAAPAWAADEAHTAVEAVLQAIQTLFH